MKIYIDLLPEDKKQEIKRKRIFREIVRQQFLFLFPVFVFILILLNVYYILKIQQSSMSSLSTTQQGEGQYQELHSYEDIFKNTNASVAALIKIQKNHLHWNKMLKEVSGKTPDGITLLSLSTKDYHVYLIGKAKTRDILLNYKNELQSSACFQDINVPLSNLVVKEDVDFQIDFAISAQCLQ